MFITHITNKMSKIFKIMDITIMRHQEKYYILLNAIILAIAKTE